MDDNIETLLKRSTELGAEKAKIIDTGSVVVEEWVRWKCLYGCAFHGKDAYHPPCAPDAESTKKVMREYGKAILLTGSKGKALTETAVRLEGEAYHMGFYKAFAMTALSSGPEGATWPSGEPETQDESQAGGQKKMRIRPLMEACGIDVFKTARANGFEIDTKRETYGRWNYFALLLIEWTLQNKGGDEMADNIIIFGKQGWPFSESARSAYGDSAVYVNVLSDRATLKEMLAYTKGVSRVPVIVQGDKVTIGHGGSWTL